MSRSYKKSASGGIATCASEKQDKRIWHKRMRAKQRQVIHHCRDYDGLVPVHFREVSNTWSMGKDGKRFWSLQEAAEWCKEMAPWFRDDPMRMYMRAISK